MRSHWVTIVGAIDRPGSGLSSVIVIASIYASRTKAACYGCASQVPAPRLAATSAVTGPRLPSPWSATMMRFVHEDLQISSMTGRLKPRPAGGSGHQPNGAAAKAGLNKSIRDARWGIPIARAGLARQQVHSVC